MFRGEGIEESVQIAAHEFVPENLHIPHVGEDGVSEHGGHGGNPGGSATGAVGEQRAGEDTGLVFDQDFELLVFDGLRYR